MSLNLLYYMIRWLLSSLGVENVLLDMKQGCLIPLKFRDSNGDLNDWSNLCCINLCVCHYLWVCLGDFCAVLICV